MVVKFRENRIDTVETGARHDADKSRAHDGAD
jgi:hypothetical protein